MQQDENIEFADNDASTGASETETSVADDIPKEQRHLRTQAYDMSISDVVAMINAKDIILDPEYQRHYIWDNKKASLLVESILLNVPIPVIYVAEDSESKWNVVDGLQRLHSLQRFFSNEFKLRGLEVLNELNGEQYSTLNPKAARILRNGILRIIMIFKESHPAIKYEIFMRLNRGAIKLKEQELRNCLYRGRLNSLLKELKQNRKFLDMLGLKAPHKRMDDEELILRFFAISDAFEPDSGEVRRYTGKMKGSLNRFMESKRDISEDEVVTYRSRFNSTIDKVHAVFGSNAFRKVNQDGTFENRPNRAIMDCIMVSFESVDGEKVANSAPSILSLLRTLPATNSEFNSAITISTSNKKQLEYRLKTWRNELKRILQ